MASAQMTTCEGPGCKDESRFQGEVPHRAKEAVQPEPASNIVSICFNKFD